MSFVNLLPEDYVSRQARRRANILCGCLFGVVMSGVLAGALVQERSCQRTREVRDRVSQAYAEAGKLINQLQQLESTKQKMLRKAKLTVGLLDRVPKSYLLATITNALPEGSSVVSFELKSRRAGSGTSAKSKTKFAAASAKRKKSARASAKKRQLTITLTGLAGTDVEVARFIAAMARCPLMQDVELVYTQEKKVQDNLVREFRVVMRLRPDADVLTDAGLARNSPRRAGEDRSARAGGAEG